MIPVLVQIVYRYYIGWTIPLLPYYHSSLSLTVIGLSARSYRTGQVFQKKKKKRKEGKHMTGRCRGEILVSYRTVPYWYPIVIIGRMGGWMNRWSNDRLSPLPTHQDRYHHWRKSERERERGRIQVGGGRRKVD